MRMLALLAYGVFALALLLGLGLYALLTQVDLDALTEAGDEVLRENYQLALTVSEDSALTLFPRPTAVLKRAELRPLGDPQAAPVAQVEELAITLDPLGLLRGLRAPVEALTLRGLILNLELDDLPGPPAADPSGGAKLGETDRLTLSLPDPATFPIARLTLQEVAVRLRQAGEVVFAVEGLEGRLERSGAALGVDLRLALRRGERVLPLALEADLQRQETGLRLAPLTLTLGPDALHGEGAVTGFETGVLTSELALRGRSFALETLLSAQALMPETRPGAVPSPRAAPSPSPLPWRHTGTLTVDQLLYQNRSLGTAQVNVAWSDVGGTASVQLPTLLRGKASAHYHENPNEEGTLTLQAEGLQAGAWDAKLAGLGPLGLEGTFLRRPHAPFGLAGRLTVLGAPGQLATGALQGPLALAATLLGDGGSAARWPERLRYQSLQGTLRLNADQAAQPFTLAIDDLGLQGTLQPGPAGTTLAAKARFAASSTPTFPVPEALREMPLPVICPALESGLVGCALDRQAFLAALQAGEGQALRNALEAAAEEKLPEALKGPARALLRGLFQRKSAPDES